MGKVTHPEFLDCVKKGKIKKFPGGPDSAHREWKVAHEDLKEAKESLSRKKYKWATIQSYYSMFHSARAMVFQAGYREHSHYCLRIALRAIYVEKGLLDSNVIEVFHMAKNLRENADYHGTFSREDADHLCKEAKNLLAISKSVVKKN